MKIAHIVISDLDGGAARAAYRLNKAINNNTVHTSRMIVMNKCSDDDKIISIVDNKFKYIKWKIKNILNRESTKLIYGNNVIFSNDIFGTNLIKCEYLRECDIIHLHWINNGMLSYRQLNKIKRLKKPIVWTLHDMNPFTGGCHYNEGCEKYTDKCGACKILNSNKTKDLAYKIQKKKHKFYKGLDVEIVGCSNWITNSAKESAVFKNYNCTNIANTIDLDIFKPIDQGIAKDILNIETNKKIILFGAMSSNSDKRKGYELLLKALKKLNPDNYIVVIFGNDKMNSDIDNFIETRYFGKVKDDYTLVLLYSAADVFIAPSKQENLANTVMEALSSGTPVVAFDIGGMPDMVKHKKNGYLAKPFDIEDLVYGVEWCSKKSQSLSEACRNHVVCNYNNKKIAKAYCEIYEKIY